MKQQKGIGHTPLSSCLHQLTKKQVLECALAKSARGEVTLPVCEELTYLDRSSSRASAALVTRRARLQLRVNEIMSAIWKEGISWQFTNKKRNTSASCDWGGRLLARISARIRVLMASLLSAASLIAIRNLSHASIKKKKKKTFGLHHFLDSNKHSTNIVYLRVESFTNAPPLDLVNLCEIKTQVWNEMIILLNNWFQSSCKIL